MKNVKETISTQSQKIRNKTRDLIAESHRENRPDSGYLNTPEAHLYYKVSGHGTPILLLHGNRQSHRIFYSYTRKLQQSYRVILMDSRGHGRSLAAAAASFSPDTSTHEHHPDTEVFSCVHARASASVPVAASAPSPAERRYFTIHDMACDAAALLDHLGIPKAILFGFSDGANIALEFACCFPERTLAVISASGNALPHGLRLPVRLGTQITGLVLGALKDCLPDCPFQKQLENRLQFNALLTDSPNLPAKRLRRIQAPVLILAGTRDLIRTSHTRWMAKQIPHSQLCLIEGGTHNVLFSREQQCRNYILDFLRQNRLSPQ